MNRFHLIFALTITMVSCTNNDINDLKLPCDDATSTTASHIDLDEAIEIAKEFGESINPSRANINVVSKVDYITSKQSRNNNNNSLGDTLAYIINYAEDNGFAIISSNNCVPPVLAYSDEGTFTLDNEIAKVNFIDNIETYMLYRSELGFPWQDPTPQFKSFLTPVVSKMMLDQGQPWNKYVALEYNRPNMPVGCTALATVNIMAYSKEELYYHDIHFDLKSTVSVIEANITGQDIETDSLNQAYDNIYKLLYWVGKDIDTEYSIDGSGANSSKARNLLYQLGYDVSSGIRVFDLCDIIIHLCNGYIVYMDGDIYNGDPHAFVCDGCIYSAYYPIIGLPSEPNIKLDASYLHFDWGWGGYGNGFYSGDVFNILAKYEDQEETDKTRIYKIITPYYYFYCRRESFRSLISI